MPGPAFPYEQIVDRIVYATRARDAGTSTVLAPYEDWYRKTWLNDDEDGPRAAITYSMPTISPDSSLKNSDYSSEQDKFQFGAQETTWRPYALAAFELWDDLIAMRMDVSTAPDANITLAFSTSTKNGGSYTGYDTDSVGDDESIQLAQIWLNPGWNDFLLSPPGLPAGNTAPPSYGGVRALETILHEIGHALGLNHPGPYNAGDTPTPSYADPNDAQFAQDTLQYTIMSYFPETSRSGGPETFADYKGWFAATPLLYDVAAIQAKYGADLNTRTDNTTYGYNATSGVPRALNFDYNLNPVICIYDAGGIDTFDFSGSATGIWLNLNPGTFSNAFGRTGNIQIAFNTVIENARGSSVADTIFGNAGNNWLRGEGGNDTLEGLAGNNLLDGGPGSDTASYYNAPYGITASLQLNIAVNIGYGTDTFQSIENLAGSRKNDTLTGDNGTNYLYGDEGRDTLVGLGGADTLEGGQGDDILYGGNDNDLLLGAAGADDAYGGEGHDTIYGGTEADRLYGEAGQDALFGEAGDDTLVGGADEDALDGGPGFDTADYSASPSRIILERQIAQATGGDAHGDTFASIERFIGTAFGDIMKGANEAETFVGGAGDDELVGRANNDTLLGGQGNDTLFGGSGADYIDGGDDYDTAVFAQDEPVVVNLSTKVHGGESAGDTYLRVERFIGTGFADSITGDGNAQDLFGQGGDDTLEGMGGNDRLYGGPGNDTLRGGDGDDVLYGGGGIDVYEGGDGYDRVSFADMTTGVAVDIGTGPFSNVFSTMEIYSIEDFEGSAYDDAFYGRANQANYFYGGNGNDILDGRGGGDVLRGEQGDDVIIVRGTELSVDGGFANFDTLQVGGTAGVFDWTLGSFTVDGNSIFQVLNFEMARGGAGADKFVANWDNLSFYGQGGNDVLWGGAGDNVLEGGAGADELYFGPGFDYADYRSDTTGVLVDIRAYIATYGDATGDTWLDAPEGILAGAGNDALGGTNGANRILGRAGNDYIAGYYGADELDGGDGDDVIEDHDQVVGTWFDTSADTVSGGDGNDTLRIAGGGDMVYGGTGTDTLQMRFGAWAGPISFAAPANPGVTWEIMAGGIDLVATVTGVEVLDIQGSPQADMLLSLLPGNDLLSGGGGDDTLAGGLGDDSLDGGTGTDTARIDSAAADASWAANPDGSWTVVSPSGGTDTLRDIENVQFADGWLTLATGTLQLSSLAIAGPAGPVVEGEGGTSDAVFTLTRTGALGQPLVVDWSVAGSGANAATAADFAGGTLPAGRLTFAAGEAIRSLSVPIAGDLDVEADEGFTVTLALPEGGAALGAASAVAGIANDDTRFDIAPLAASRAEGQGGTTGFTFTVARAGSLSGAQSVAWSVAGTVADAADFPGGIFPSGVVSFAPGQASRTLTVPVAGDLAIEGDEGFSVTLSAPSKGATIGTAVASGTIGNDDLPNTGVLAIARQFASRAEGQSGPTSFTFLVTRSADTTGPAVAKWQVGAGTIAGTVSAGAADFAGGVLPGGTVSFAPGQTSRTISVPVLGDAAAELNESFTVALMAPAPGVSLATASATGLIWSDDGIGTGTLSIARAAAQRAEGHAGGTGFTFSVTRSGDTSGTASADWAVTGGGVASTVAAGAADFVGGVLPSGRVSFAAGETSRTVTVNVTGDAAIELNESFTVTLGGLQAGVALGTAAATGVILNDDAPPSGTLAIAALQASRGEGDAGTTAFTFAVTRSGSTTGPASADWAVVAAGGEGVADATDFAGGALPFGTVSFAPGQLSRTITVAVAGDGAVEGAESFAVQLANAPAGVAIGTGSADGLIWNDDPGGTGTLSIARDSAVRAEGHGGATLFTFLVTRGGDASGPAAADWSVAGAAVAGTVAAAGADFVGGQMPAGRVSFAAGETAQLVTVAVQGDAVAELNESFAVLLSNPQAGVALGTASATGVIRGDDFASTAANQTLTGTDSADLFLLGGGLDVVAGRGGTDLFRFLPAAIGPAGTNATTLNDFSRAAGEVLDLSAIDAVAGTLAEDAFSFIGTGPFTAAGQLRWQDQGTVRLVQGEVTGDGVADLTIVVKAAGPVAAEWFIL